MVPPPAYSDRASPVTHAMGDALALDPQFSDVIGRLTSARALPLVRGRAEETRDHSRALEMSRRGEGYAPEPVAEVTDRAVDGPAGPVPVRVYTPLDDRGRVVTYLHGGGWVMGDLDTHDPVCRRGAHAIGGGRVSVEHRVG